ncbi:MAG: hypothetical protein J7L83_04330 [Thaumarchaeota archaeon]|nr:hypothetical protein [Nitrososphaerota archaeon]
MQSGSTYRCMGERAELTVNFAAKKASITDLLSLFFYPDDLFRKKRPEILEKIMEENAELHLRYGFDNTEMVVYNYRGWTLEGIPDGIYPDKVAEGKVVRRASNVYKLKAYAWVQAGFYALALNKRKFEIVLFKPDLSDYFRREFDTYLEEPRIKSYLDYAIDVLEQLRTLRKIGLELVNGGWENEQLG